MGYLKCIDISNWQAGIDIDAALASVDAIIFKASEGTGFVDPECVGWVKAAKKAGKPFGLYHFFRGRGAAEADHFLKVCKSWIGQGVLILDVETDECSKAEVQAFVKRVHDKTGVWPWVYTSAAFVSRYMNDYVKAHCALWCAGYPTQPASWTKREFPYGGYTGGCTVVAWQFTDKLKIAGMSVDASAVYITPEHWAKYAKPNAKTTDGGKTMISNCGHDENGGYSGGAAGDQTGTEWQVIPWYNRPWDNVWEPPSEAIGEDLALLARHAAENDRIGYDQSQRTTFYSALMKAPSCDPANITTDCECDCSSGVAALVAACGVRNGMKAMAEVSRDCWTGNLGAALAAAGFKKHIGAKYTSGDSYLGRGWVLLNEGAHTAICVSDGANFSGGGGNADGRSIDELAHAVIAGEFGNGDVRKAALGDKYAKVQARVNEILDGGAAGSGARVDVDDLAKRVIAGEFGNGDARKKALGANYAAVQKRVNEMLGGSDSATDIDALARAVIRGDYGNGDERKRRLGSKYAAVQRRVNELLS